VNSRYLPSDRMLLFVADVVVGEDQHFEDCRLFELLGVFSLHGQN